MKIKGLRILFLGLLAVMIPAVALAWPTANQWIPVYKNNVYLQDPNGDANGSRNVVSDATHAAAFIFNDGTYMYFRLRLDKDPTGQGGQGMLQAYGWGVEFDTNQNPADYEWLMMVDGISQTEVIQLWQNTVQGTLGSATDKPEILQYTQLLAGNYQISAADTAFNGDTDYFLDWRFPYATFKSLTGLTDSSPVRFFFGSSSSANNLTQSGADLVGGSDLYEGLTDVSTPSGTKPTTGTVRFVANLAGGGDVTQIFAGDTIYIRVDDADLNTDSTSLQTTTVTLLTTGGDTATVTLTETGVNTGVFTGSFPTQAGSPILGDAILQVRAGQTVTVQYIDGIDASYNRNQIRADSLYVVSLAPAISLQKSADPTSAPPGAEITYTIYYANAGIGAASNLIIADSVPLNTTYVAGSLRLGNAASTYATATPLTDATDGDAGQVVDANILFTIATVSGNDGVANSGGDEGRVYFKIRIN